MARKRAVMGPVSVPGGGRPVGMRRAVPGEPASYDVHGHESRRRQGRQLEGERWRVKAVLPGRCGPLSGGVFDNDTPSDSLMRLGTLGRPDNRRETNHEQQDGRRATPDDPLQ